MGACRFVTGLAVLVLLFAPRAVADVLVVESPGGFPTIQDAVDAALDGDTVLVTQNGSHPSVTIDGKAVSLLVDDTLNVVVNGRLEIRNLPAGEQLSVSGLIVLGDIVTQKAEAVLVADCAGVVWLQHCIFVGSDNLGCAEFTGLGFEGAGQHGLRVQNADALVVERCNLQGGEGGGGSYGDPCYIGGDGGAGLHVDSSSVSVIESLLSGGPGGSEDGESVGGNGGPGCHSDAGFAVILGGVLTGGPGGFGFDFIPVGGFGNGGDGLRTTRGAHTRVRDLTLMAGSAGQSAFGVPGNAGMPLNEQGSSYAVLPGDASTTSATERAVREGESFQLTVTGTPGHALLLIADSTLSPLYMQGHLGVLMPGIPFGVGPLTLGVLPGSGVRHFNLGIPELGPGLDALSVAIQAVLLPPSGLYELTTADVVTALDASF